MKLEIGQGKKLAHSKTLLAALFLTAILFTSTISYIYGVGSISNTTIESGSMASTASYVVLKEGSTYYARNGITGEVMYASSNPTTLTENILSEIYGVGGEIHYKIANYVFTSTVDLPVGTKNVVFSGESGFGKSYQTQGTTFTSTVANAPLFKVTSTSDTRSAYAITFRDIKFIGPNTAGSTAVDLSNTDTAEIESCTFLSFGVSVYMDYVGSSYPVGEQPGKLFMHDNELAEGVLYYVQLKKATQCYLTNNVFESFGTFTRSVDLTDVNKIYIKGNEFDQSSTPAAMESFIYITASYGGIYVPHEIQVSNNWAYRVSSVYTFIKVVGTGKAVYGVYSDNNIVEHGYTPNELTDSGYIVVEDPNYHQVQASDNIAPFSSQMSRLRDNSGWTAGTTRRNLWAPATVYAKVTIPNGGVAVIQQSYNTTVWGICSFANSNLQAETVTLVFRVPTLYYWKILLTGGASQISLVVEYE